MITKKSRARKSALQALYQWFISNQELFEIESQFHAYNNIKNVDINHFRLLLYKIPKNINVLKKNLLSYLDRSIDQINPIELLILYIGAFELIYCFEIPYCVVINESILLSKLFGASGGYKYINGVLHNLAKNIRKHEFLL